MTSKPTCGPLWLKALDLSNLQSEEEDFGKFSWGHLTASAEKVWMGTCTAAMFRPKTSEKFVERLWSITTLYELTWEEIEGEYWIYDSKNSQYIQLIRNAMVNSPLYHFVRGILCGIPVNQIDLLFHQRHTIGREEGLPGVR